MRAFLCKRLSRGQAHVSQNYTIRRTKGQNRGTAVFGEEEDEFVLVTNDEQLRGLILKEFFVVDDVDRRMIEIARSRVR